MSIKSIIAPVRGDGKGESVLGLALAIGRKFNSHIDVLHVHAKPEDMIPFGVPVPRMFRQTIMDAAGNIAHQEEERLRAIFDDYCARHDAELMPVDASECPPDRLTVSWREEAGKQVSVIRDLGTLADLIVVARPDEDTELGMNSLMCALFDVRKLTAIAPPQVPETTGSRIAIAWNGSGEAARAVTWALPLLLQAETVTILMAPDENNAAKADENLRRYLCLHGIQPESRTFKIGRRDIGGPLLEAAQKDGADMLVMGAFGAEKRRELVLGGVTQHVIQNAGLPLIMAH
jgi:nucleotide-binding universal stress UspA family protein